MSNLKYLKKEDVKQGDTVLYFKFALPDTSAWNTFAQVKPLLEELKTVMPLLNQQAKKLHGKADELQKQHDLAVADENEIRDQLTQAKETIKDLEETALLNAEAMEILSEKMEFLKNQAENSKSNKPVSNNQALINSNASTQNAIKAVESISLTSSPFKTAPETITIDGSDNDSNKRQSNLKLKIQTNLSTFSGLPDQIIGEFIYGADRLFELGHYSDAEKVNVASSYLKGIAFSDWLLHEREYGKQTWKQFCEYMKTKYTPANHTQVIRSRIRNLKQITSVKDYYLQFRILCIQAPELGSNEKLDHFITNLKPDYAKFVLYKECKTIEEAYNAAVLHESINGEYTQVTSSFMSARNQNVNNQNNSWSNQIQNYSDSNYFSDYSNQLNRNCTENNYDNYDSDDDFDNYNSDITITYS